MNLHVADLTHRLNDYLARRQPPKSFGGNDKLKADQVGAYLSILRRFAPEGERLDEWWRGFITRLGEDSDTWAWPTEKEVIKACKAATGDTARKSDSTAFAVDSVKVNVARLRDNQPIGDGWLWGRNALRMMAVGGVSMSEIKERRDSHCADLRDLYGEAAERMIADLNDRHEHAIKLADSQASARRLPPSPDKRITHLIEAAE